MTYVRSQRSTNCGHKVVKRNHVYMEINSSVQESFYQFFLKSSLPVSLQYNVLESCNILGLIISDNILFGAYSNLNKMEENWQIHKINYSQVADLVLVQLDS